MRCGVIYLLSGLPHAVRLVVSLWSLRKQYEGPVVLYSTTDETADVCARCAADRRLAADHRHVDPVDAPRNVAFLTKIRALQVSPFHYTAYLDADTLIVGRIDELLSPPPDAELTSTAFAGWSTAKPLIARRIERWQGLDQSLVSRDWIESLVAAALQPQPAVNGGVVAARPDAEVLDRWLTLSLAGVRTFICDEIALQLLLTEIPHRLLDCRYNSSPLHAPATVDVRIWHFHGGKHLRPGLATDLWLPAFRECMRNNVASLAKWAPAEDQRLAEYLDGERSGISDAFGTRIAAAGE